MYTAKFDFDVSSLYHTKRREPHVTDFNNRIKQHHGAIKSGNADARNKAAIMGQTDIDIQQKAGFLTEQEANQHRYYMAKMQDYFDGLETATAGRTPGEAALYVYNNELPGLDHDDRDKMFKSLLLDQTIMDENFKNSKIQSQKSILQGLAGERGLFLKPGDITNLYLEVEGPGSREFFGELFADRRTAKIDGTVSKYDMDEPGAFVSQSIKAIAGTMEWDEIMGKVGDGVSIATANKLSQLENDSQNLPSRTKKRTGRYLASIAKNVDIKDEDKNEVITELLHYTFKNPESESETTDMHYRNLLDDYTLTDNYEFSNVRNKLDGSESIDDDSTDFFGDKLIAGGIGIGSGVPSAESYFYDAGIVIKEKIDGGLKKIEEVEDAGVDVIIETLEGVEEIIDSIPPGTATGFAPFDAALTVVSALKGLIGIGIEEYKK